MCGRCGAVHRSAGDTLPCFRAYALERGLAFWEPLRGKVLKCPGCGIGGLHCHGRVIEELLSVSV